jgi:hypothetical protein
MKNVEVEKQLNICFYKDTMKKRIKYLNNKKIINTNSKDEINFSINEENMAKQELMWYTYNLIALNEQYSNDDYVAFFVTITLQSQFHKYKSFKNNHINNPKYIESNSVNLSYKILNQFFRTVSKNFRVNREYKKVTFAKVIEPHKDNYTPHLHSIVWIKKEYAKDFESYLYKQIDKSKDIGQSKIEPLEDVSRASGYILKYMQKNFKEDSYKNYYGSRLRHSLRAFTFSKTLLNKDIFNKLSFNFSKNTIKHPDIIEEYTNNYYKLVSMFTSVTTKIIDTETGEVKESTKVASEDDIFQVLIKKERCKIDDIYEYKIDYLSKLTSIKSIESNLKSFKLFDSFNYFCFDSLGININQIEDEIYRLLLDEFLEELKNKSRYSYKIINYQIYKKTPSNCQYDLVFDKKEWEILTKN